MTDFSGYLATMGLVVILYDTLLTFSDEAECIWCRHWTSLSSILVLTARYLGICIFVLSFIINMETLSPTRCTIVSFAMQSCKLLVALAVNGCLLYRVYFLLGTCKSKTSPMILLFIVLTGLDISAILYASCHSKSARGSYVTGVVASAIAPLYDFGYIIIIVVAFWGDWGVGGLSGIFLEEARFSAVIQCIVLAVWSIESATTGKLAGINVSGVNVSLPDAISIISISRSLFDLRQAATAGDAASLDAVTFDRGVGSTDSISASTYSLGDTLIDAMSISTPRQRDTSVNSIPSYDEKPAGPDRPGFRESELVFQTAFQESHKEIVLSKAPFLEVISRSDVGRYKVDETDRETIS